MLHYILQVICFQLSFLLVYEFLLKKETFFSYNRFYLLITPVLAFFLPLLRIPVLAEAVPQNARILLPEVWIGAAGNETISLPAVILGTPQSAALDWVSIVYLTGFSITLFLFLRKYLSLNRLFRFNSSASETKGFRLIEIPDSRIACTFFNTIFLGKEFSAVERKQILSHELVHVRQKHSFDLLFFELLKIFFWFNPLVYLYQSRLATLHEFIADADVVRTTAKKDYYNQLLNSAFNTQNISFINQFFNQSLTRLSLFGRSFVLSSGGQVKKRIVMLQKSKSKAIFKFKFLALVPLMLVMLSYVACSEESTKEGGETAKIENATVSIEVGELQNLTSEERAEIVNTFEEMSQDAGFNKVKVTDGKKTVTFNGESKNSATDILAGAGKNTSDQQALDKIPFAVVDEVPVFPGCANLTSNEDRKSCMSNKITEFVNKNFDSNEAKKYAAPGINRVIVQFRINKEGKVVDVRARAKTPELEKEGIHVIESIPQMTPGKQKGQPVSVMYSLPIIFQNAQ
ncbi:MAG: M56 family metallopeptidase [Salegentibacter sp.]